MLMKLLVLMRDVKLEKTLDMALFSYNEGGKNW